MLSSRVIDIRPTEVSVEYLENRNVTVIANDFVLALTGFRPDRKLLFGAGVEMTDEMEKPVFNPDTMETEHILALRE
ncbi:hypothetical protein D3C75_1133130 [compost metagenome]